MKHEYNADYFNFYVIEDYKKTKEFILMLGPTKGHAHPPVDRNELKRLADFINKLLEN